MPLVEQFMCILNRMIASIAWTYPALFFQCHGPPQSVMLHHISNQTYNKVTVVLHKQCDIKYKLLQTLPHGMFRIHSPQSNCFTITDYQRSQKFWIYVKCEQHSTKRHKNISDSKFITWSVIGAWLTFSAISVIFDNLTSKTSHHISTTKRWKTCFTTRNPILQNLKEITFREAFQEFLSWIKHTQTKPPISFY